MNRLHTTIAKAAALAVLATASGLACAADASTLAVTATISGLCKFTVASTPLAFGAIDPSSTVNAVTTANVGYKCTKNTASAGVTATGGTARTMTSGADTMGYTLGFTGDTQAGQGFGPAITARTLVVTGTVTPAQFQDAAAGNYAENVTLNITP